MIYDKSNAILTYGVDDFLKFLNETIFTGCKEKAYIERLKPANLSIYSSLGLYKSCLSNKAKKNIRD